MADAEAGSVVAESAPAWLILLLATACGLIVANIYYAQPLVGPISAALGLSPEAAGLIVTMSQIGYGIGLLLVVPLGDLFENRRLVVSILVVATVALATASMATHIVPFLGAALIIGLGSCAVQILIPYAAHIAPEASRGRVVGSVTSGIMLGIMLARPASSALTHASSWQTVFVASAVLMAGLAVLLRVLLPPRQPVAGPSYGALLRSMLGLVRTTPALRRRGLYQAGLFGAFSLFWTTVPLLLADTYHLSQAGIAWFALAGVAGAVAAPLAGHLADRGWGRALTAGGLGAGALAFLLMRVGVPGSIPSLAALVVAAIILDASATANLVVGQRAIFSLGAHLRGRLNGLLISIFFVGGAVGSAVGGWAYATGGWPLTTGIGFCLPGAALLYFLTERRGG